MKIAVVTAMPEETKAVLRGVEFRKMSLPGKRVIYRSRIAAHEISLVEAGMGMLNASRAAADLVAERPQLMISAGFGGAVLPGLAVGDAVLAERVLQWTENGGEEVAAGFFTLDRFSGIPSLVRGIFITSDAILDKRTLGARLGEDIPSPVVEMESAAVARVAAANGIPFLGIRVVSDPWDEELDFAIHEFCDDNMRIRPLRVLATILRRPRIIPQLVRLAHNSRIAAAGLAEAMKRLLLRI